jgi:hypothetical protein
MTAQPAAPANSGKKKSRSPAYPFVPLKKAIERAGELYSKESKHGARFDVVAPHWGYKATSSGAMQTVAALRQFGLISVEGGVASSRIIKLTELAIRILLDEREPEKSAAIRQAALKPKLYAQLWAKYGATPPSDASILSFLKVDLDFNPTIAPAVLQAYKDTIAFAKPDPATIVSVSDENSDDDDDGSEAEDEEQAMTPEPQQQRQAPPPPRQQPPAGAGETREAEVLRTKLAGGRSVRVLFSGPPPTRAEISKLIAHLELSKDDYPESLLDQGSE